MLPRYLNRHKHRWLIGFFIMGCVGITTEVFFTSIMGALRTLDEGQPFNPQLKGWSYPWMFPIYGIAALTFPVVSPSFQHLHWLVRGLIYTAGIFAVEFASGALLEAITGVCPWKYTTGWHVLGYIRLDFAPAWFVFGLWIEWILNQVHAPAHLPKE